MKLRIKSHSVRFRITAEEAELLQSTGQLLQQTRIPTSSGNVVPFQYEIKHLADAAVSELEMMPFGMRLVLNAIDFAALANTSNEGVYIRRPWIAESSQPINFVVYIEKDKPRKYKKDKKHKNGTVHNDKSQDTSSPEVREK